MVNSSSKKMIAGRMNLELSERFYAVMKHYGWTTQEALKRAIESWLTIIEAEMPRTTSAGKKELETVEGFLSHPVNTGIDRRGSRKSRAHGNAVRK